MVNQITKAEESIRENNKRRQIKGLKWRVDNNIKNSDRKEEQKGKDILAKEKNKKKKENKGIVYINP